MSKKAKRVAADGLLFAAILGLTVYAVFHGEDLPAARQAIRSCDGRWLIPGLACVAAFIGGEAVILRLLLRSEGQRLGLGRCWLVSATGFFFSAVTPSAGGGQPMQVYFLRKEKVPVAVSAVTLMAVTLTYKLVLVTVGLGMIVFRLDYLREHFGNMFFLFWIGMGLTCGFVALLMILIFHPRIARSLAGRTLDILERLRILRGDKTARRERLWAAMDRYHETAAYFKSHMGLMALVQAITFVQRFVLFTVPWLVCRAMGLTGVRWTDVVFLQASISAAADMLPLPGGLGVTEGLFLTVFEPVFGSLVLPAMVLSRGTEFYCRLLVSAVFTLAAALILGRHRKREVCA